MLSKINYVKGLICLSSTFLLLLTSSTGYAQVEGTDSVSFEAIVAQKLAFNKKKHIDLSISEIANEKDLNQAKENLDLAIVIPENYTLARLKNIFYTDSLLFLRGSNVHTLATISSAFEELRYSDEYFVESCVDHETKKKFYVFTRIYSDLKIYFINIDDTPCVILD